MTTFTEKGDPQLSQKSPVATNALNTQEDNDNPIQTYLNTLGKEHIELARKKVRGHTKFTINLRKPGTVEDEKKVYHRIRLTREQLNEIVTIHAGSRKRHIKAREWPRKIASYCLYDSTNKQFMTEEDFNRAKAAELSVILDGIMLLEMLGPKTK
jgi:hypothetical protein